MDYNFDSMTNLFFTLSDVMYEYEEGNTDALQNFYKSAMEKEPIPAATDYADIYQEQDAVLHFIRWFYATTPCIDLDDCTDALAIHLEDNFCDSDAPMINLVNVQHVLEVVDSIFPNYRNVVKNFSISILAAERKERNGESIAIMDEETEQGAIFLYRMWNDFDGNFTPEAVLLHEMGHQLHFFLTKTLNIVPDSFVPYLKSIGAHPEDLNDGDLLEVFADTFLLAVVHKTKELGDPFPMIDENTKALCYAYIASLFSPIS